MKIIKVVGAGDRSRRRLLRAASAALTRRLMATQHKGYEAFGSFHTPSTNALFAGDSVKGLPNPATFLPPLTPDDRLDLSAFASAGGESHNQALFTIALGEWTYLNHGAFGGPTRYASRVASAWRAFSDTQPLLFNDRLLFPYIVQSIQALARVVRVSDPQELVLLPNATAGLHAVLASVLTHTHTENTTEGEDVVVCFTTRYGAVRKMLQSLETSSSKRQRPLRVHEEPLSLDESYDDALVVHKLEQALDKVIATSHEGTKCPLVVLDHITSNTGVLLPVQQLVKACHARGVPVLVDGAHALLNLDLNIDEIGADYYVGNCHKWFASPKGAAFLHVNKKKTPIQQTKDIPIVPRVVSHGFFDGYQSAFMWTGLQDYAPWLSLPSCIAFWEMQDPTKCREYMHELTQQATERLYTAWGMDRQLQDAMAFPRHKRHAMRLVELPPREIFGVDCSLPGAATSTNAKRIQDTLHHDHCIEVPVKCVDSKLFVRISAHVYNRMSDYERLAHVISS